MLTLRKAIARRPCLVAVLGCLLLALNQQVIACDMMMLTPAQAGQHFLKHDKRAQQMDSTKKPCCDFSFEFSAAGQCHIDQGTVINSSLSGKLNPDHHPVLITTTLQDLFPYPLSPPFALIPDQATSRPGVQTYLITQRLRI